PDGDALVYTAPALPPGATFDGAPRQFRWTPAGLPADQTGGHTSARFAVSDGKVTSEATVDITVTGTVVTIAPSSLSFPTTRVGQGATPLPVTVTNGGSQSFRVVAAATTNSVFPVTATLPATLGAGEQVGLEVGFAPTASSSYSDTLTVTTDDAACPTTSIPIGGVGQTSGVAVSRSGADFGSVRLGTASAPISFTVTNVGDAPFTVTAVVLSDATDFSLTLTSPDASAY